MEVMASDDGSGTEQAEWLLRYCAEVARRYPFVLPPAVQTANTGKGGAIYAGWNSAGDDVTHLAFADADGAVPPDEVARLIGVSMRHPETAVIAVRTGEDETVVIRTPGRRIAGEVFRALVRWLFRFPVPDTQCGCKVIPRTAYAAAAPELRERRFCFDVELIWHLLRAGVPLRPVPIHWSERPGSRMKPSSVWSMFTTLYQIRRRLGDWREAQR